MKKYMTVIIHPERFPGDTLSSDKIDEELNQYAKDGWTLHSFSVTEGNCGITLICVFEK